MRFRYKDVNGACVGSLSIPTTVGSLSVNAVGDDRADALGRAALIAERIASDPVMSALMPPQALVAIKAAKGLAAAAKRGTRVLRGFWGRLRGAGKKRLAKALHDEAAKQEGGEVGWSFRNPFKKRKKSRRIARRPMPEERDEEPEEPEEPEAAPQEAADIGDDDAVNGGEGGIE